MWMGGGGGGAAGGAWAKTAAATAVTTIAKAIRRIGSRFSYELLRRSDGRSCARLGFLFIRDDGRSRHDRLHDEQQRRESVQHSEAAAERVGARQRADRHDRFHPHGADARVDERLRGGEEDG